MKTFLFPTLSVLAVLAADASAQAPAGAATPEQLEEGKKTYMTCMPCHQPTGLGLPPVFPPLAKTEYVNGPADRLAAMILKGNAGPMTVNGMQYNQVMPGQEATLNDQQIAAVMTYVRQSFGNNSPAVSADVVAAARKKFAGRTAPWTEAELKAWKSDDAAAAPAAPAAQ